MKKRIKVTVVIMAIAIVTASVISTVRRLKEELYYG